MIDFIYTLYFNYINLNDKIVVSVKDSPSLTRLCEASANRQEPLYFVANAVSSNTTLNSLFGVIAAIS